MEVDTCVNAALRHIDLTGAKARNAAHLRINYALHERSSHRSVDCVATAREYLCAGFRSFWLSCDDHRFSTLVYRHESLR